MRSPKDSSPPVDLLEPGVDLEEFREVLSVYGKKGSHVAITRPTELAARSLRGVRGIYAYAPFSCRIPLPDVRELLLTYRANVDEATARCFGGTENLRIESQQPVNLTWVCHGSLQGLALSDRSISDPQALRSIPLQRVAVIWTQMPLEYVPESVAWLSIAAMIRPPLKRLEPIWSLGTLRSLRLVNVELRTLEKCAKLPLLSRLSVSSAKSFKGVGALQHLRAFHFAGPNCPSIAELAREVPLTELDVQAATPPPDLKEIGKIASLEKLKLVFGNIHGPVTLPSLAFLGSLKKLRHLEIHGVRAADQDTSFVDALPSLEFLELTGDFGHGTEKVTLRGVRGRRRPMTQAISPPKKRAAAIKPRFISGAWTIFDDLSKRLGVANNYDAELVVRKRLKAVAPDLVDRIDFDSEAESFAASLKSKKDAERLVSIIRSISQTPSQRPG